jgi:lipopolysaccharide/colanic/teichoic acid biosynthesis glycosyltransferase
MIFMTDIFRRIIDIFVSVIALIMLSPLLIVIGIAVYFSSPGGVLYCSRRIGRFEKPFTLYKFRSMVSGVDKMGTLNVAHTDSRVTTVGRFLRVTKFDEFPQFFNVLIGDMTLIGPRPDIPEYIDKVPEERKKIILSVKPGLSDWASLFAFAQYAEFAKTENPDIFHLKYIHPIKLSLQEYYCSHRSLKTDAYIFLLTALRILKINTGLPKEIKRIIDKQIQQQK